MTIKSGHGLCLEAAGYQKNIDGRLKKFSEMNLGPRLWNRDEYLWISRDQLPGLADVPMGWLDVAEKMSGDLPAIEDFATMIRHEGFNHIVLLGMGGSSLAPYVFSEIFRNEGNGIDLLILDSTDPEMIKKIESQIDLSTTMFVVSSKSGTTAEVQSFFTYFYYRMSLVRGEHAGNHFIAITDQGSPLAALAEDKNFRKIFINYKDIGGRYSALSYYGIVPAALIGVNVKELLKRTREMIKACGPNIHPAENPGLVLGAAIGELAIRGVDKLTYLMPPELRSFGLWMEQLIAESTGKSGKGILPVDGEPYLGVDTFGVDRFFVQYGFAGKHVKERSLRREEITGKSFPLINVRIDDKLDIGREFFRWEIATAVAGAILGVNPFDQPNVEESKKCTNELLRTLSETGNISAKGGCLEENGLSYYSVHKSTNATNLISEFIASAKVRDYITLQAYLPETAEIKAALSSVQENLQRRLKLAVSTQFGPRYLHSTGQYHKGGPAGGIFIQFISGSGVDIQIPDKKFTFGMLKRAQALGDREALQSRNRRVILVDLGEEPVRGLATFLSTLTEATLSLKLSKKLIRGKGMKKAALENMPLIESGTADKKQPVIATMMFSKKKRRK